MVTPAQRTQNLAQLRARGFLPVDGLPLTHEPKLRPAREIASRLCALDAGFVWVVESEEDVPEAKVRGYVERSRLEDAMTEAERAIWRSPRDAARAHQPSIGWRLENEWALAWALGFETPPEVSGEMIDDAMIRAVVLGFLPKHSEGVDTLLARAKPRSLEEVDVMEDLFYCAHNAARSAQLGRPTVPRGFHPIAGGGVIHERRHALTWCMSPGVAWDDVDLST
jgi:hypothetical protein